MLERRFQETLGALNTRESSTLVLATVASTASLVLFGIAGDTQNDKARLLLHWAGLLFPLLGVLYRELTILSIDLIDVKYIRELAGYDRWPHPRQTKSVFQRTIKQIRRVLVRVFLLFPTFPLWSVRMLDYSDNSFILALILLALFAAVPTVIEVSVKQ